jgi:hypothetical protein
MPGQLYDWTCSACALEWVMRSTGLIAPSDIYASRESVVYEIGYPENINSTYGLINADGSALQAVLENHGQESAQSWLDFDTVYDLAQGTTGMLSGAAWYHWVALRGVQGDTIWIANSAPGYKSVWSNLSRSDWDRLGGWSVVWLT